MVVANKRCTLSVRRDTYARVESRVEFGYREGRKEFDLRFIGIFSFSCLSRIPRCFEYKAARGIFRSGRCVFIHFDACCYLPIPSDRSSTPSLWRRLRNFLHHFRFSSVIDQSSVPTKRTNSPGNGGKGNVKWKSYVRRVYDPAYGNASPYS